MLTHQLIRHIIKFVVSLINVYLFKTNEKVPTTMLLMIGLFWKKTFIKKKFQPISIIMHDWALNSIRKYILKQWGVKLWDFKSLCDAIWWGQPKVKKLWFYIIV